MSKRNPFLVGKDHPFLAETRTSTLVRKKLELEQQMASLQAQLNIIDSQIKSKLTLGYMEEVKVNGVRYNVVYAIDHYRKILDATKLNAKFGKAAVDKCRKSVPVVSLKVTEL